MSATSKIKILIRFPGQAVQYASFNEFDAVITHDSYKRLILELELLRPELTILLITLKRRFEDPIIIRRDTYSQLQDGDRLSVLFQPANQAYHIG